MKKKLLSVFLVMTMVLSVTACGKTDGKTDSTTSTTTAESGETYLEQLAIDQKTYAQYVTLGQYTGIEVEVDRSTLEVTDEDTQEYITGILTENATLTPVTTRATKSGDVITLDYSGLMDGVAFSGGTATDVEYTVGSAGFITDLDQGLVGREIGIQYDLPCTFPSDYQSADLAGKTVTFQVTVSAISESILPEYTDTFVQSVASTYSSTATTTTEFTAFVKDYLVKTAQDTFDTAKYSLIWEKVLANCSISGYPETELQELQTTVEANITAEYPTETGIAEYAKEYAQSYLDEKMIITMIAEKENITVTDEQIAEMGAQLAEYYQYASFQEIIDTYGSEITLEVGYSVLSDSVITLLLDKAVEK